MIIFIHIRKTSGSSVNYILQKQKGVFWYKFFNFKHPNRKIQYDNDQIVYINNYKKDPDIISGHIPYGIHKIFGTNDYSYFTFLRNPIERWKSHFYHAVQHKQNNIMKELFKRRGLKEMLEYFIERDATCNIMTKQLSGTESLYNICPFRGQPETASGFGYNQVYGWAARYHIYTVDEMNTFLEQAIDNLFRNIDFVGFQEHTKEDYSRLCSYYNFKIIKFNKRFRVTPRKTKVDWNDKKIKMLLNEANKYDNILYEKAYAYFKNQ
jgi:hypothetical protein